MKFAPRVLLGLLALAFASAALALAFISEPLTKASQSKAGAASQSTTTAANVANRVNATPTPFDASSATPTSASTPADEPPLPPPTAPAISSASYQQGMILRRDGDYAHAAESFRLALGQNPDPSTAREIRFRLGESTWLAGDFDRAVTEFNQLLAQNQDDNLAARVHYFLADILTQRKSFTQAIVHLRAYRAQTHTLMGEIDGQIGDLLLAGGDTSGAIAQYEVAVQDQTLTAAQRVDLLERVAGAQSKLGHPGLAAARLGEAFSLAPDNTTRADVEYRWGLTLDAAQERAAAVTHWQHALATYPDQDGAYQSLVELLNRQVAVDDYQRGLADYFSKSYAPAILAFNRDITSSPKNSAAARYYVGLSYLENGQTTLAIKAFDGLLQKYPNDRRRADTLFSKATAYNLAAATDNAVATYDQFADLYPGDPRADDALWRAAQSLDEAGRSDEARAQYDKLAAKYPSSPQTPPAVFSAGFDYYLSKDYASAEARWKTLAKLFPKTADADRALFWLGKLAGARNDIATSQQYLRQAAESPRSYYGWRALYLLGGSDSTPSYNIADYGMSTPSSDQVGFERWLAHVTGGGPVSSQLGAQVLSDFHFRRGSELAQLDRAPEARAEFQKVNTRFRSDANSLYALAEYYQQNNYFDLSIDAAVRIQTLSGVSSEEQLPHLLRALIYPTYYADLIVPYAQRNGIDPALLFALVRQESRYDPLAKSWVAAAGLTQVMPPTGSGIARELGVRGFQQADLLKPYISVRFGAYYLGQVLKSFDGNILYALAGYNGGPGNAKKWVRPDEDMGVEVIHLTESSIYVRTVYSQYNEYVEIYRGKQP